MTTYRAIAGTETDPDAPITSALMKALAGNVLAIREGDASAPKIVTAAITDANVTSAKLATTNNERNWVLARLADMSLGAVGTFAYLAFNTAGAVAVAGTSYAASNLRYGGSSANSGDPGVGATPSGTWLALGSASDGSQRNATLFVRIS